MRLFLGSLPVVLCLALPGCVQWGTVKPVVRTDVTVAEFAATPAPVPETVRAADVIYVGEIHDDSGHHAYEAKLIQTLAQARLPFVVGWEMFGRSQQALLDRYDRHRLSQLQLIRATGFQRSWAVYSPWYGRILEETRRYKIANLPLNAAPALVHKVARGEPLTPEEQAQLPKGFHAQKGAFQNFAAMMGAHPGVGTGDLHRFFAAQSVWEQTMAAAIVEFRVAHPSTRVVVLTGRGHLQDGFGIPAYVAQKLNVHQLVLFPRSQADR
ncbi:MAG TPA: ChaN family lipoprotein [Chthoniobacterales bacterium]